MAALTSTPAPVKQIQHQRFTTEQHGYTLWDVSLSLSGNIAVSGYHSESKQTFIDLFECNSDATDNSEPIYTTEIDSSSNDPFRYVSFLEKNGSELLVTCDHLNIGIIDPKNETISSPMEGRASCLAVREGEIFIGLNQSNKVTVCNNLIPEKKSMSLKGKIGVLEWPCELQVIKETVFLVTAPDGKALSTSVRVRDSKITHYTNSTKKYECASSITVSERLDLVAVLWGNNIISGNQIIFYSLKETKPFKVFDLDCDVRRIRISDKDRMIVTGNQITGEIKMYHLDELLSFEAMKRTLANMVSPDECEKFRKFFEITEDDLSKIGVSDENESKKLSEEEKKIKRMECLLTIIEEKGQLSPKSTETLTNAVSSFGDGISISNLKGTIEGYVLYWMNVENRMAEMMTRQKTWEDERNQLSSKLEAAESTVKEEGKKLDDLQGELVDAKKQYEEQEKTSREMGTPTIEELEREATELQDELNQINRSLNIVKTKVTTLIEKLGKAKAESTT